MSERQALIQRLLELQKKFIEYEHEHGIDPEEYYTPPPGHPLANYRQEYRDLSMKLVELAHQEVGSHP
ncbi:MAG: hypothetical protein D6819_01935 [Gammaproteobacteria bacterium]|nr:MAG: hypothetical protein D6819_01935 [Gammaproteobacteria bacterium]